MSDHPDRSISYGLQEKIGSDLDLLAMVVAEVFIAEQRERERCARYFEQSRRRGTWTVENIAAALRALDSE